MSRILLCMAKGLGSGIHIAFLHEQALSKMTGRLSPRAGSAAGQMISCYRNGVAQPRMPQLGE